MNRNDRKENSPDNEFLKTKLVTNLKKTFDLIELHQGLKFALYKKLYPTKSAGDLLQLMSMANLKRKQFS